MFDDTMRQQATALLQKLRRRKLMLATAESCTGGLIAGLLTEIAGSSDVVERGYVTYSNEAKHACLGVPLAMIEQHGAVSEEVARAMAEGTIAHSLADVAVSVTGIAGPGGGMAVKPVGLVHIGAARRGGATVHEKLLLGDIGRSAIRLETVRRALALTARLVE